MNSHNLAQGQWPSVLRKNVGQFDIVYTMHRNQLYKETNKMHFLYVFILQFLYNSTCFERPFRSSSGVHNLLYHHELLMMNEIVVRNT